MRYSSIISIVALGLASFSVAAPVGSNAPDSGEKAPAKGSLLESLKLPVVGDLGKDPLGRLIGGKYSTHPGAIERDGG